MQNLKSDSNEVKQLVGRVLTHIGESVLTDAEGNPVDSSISSDVLRQVVPALVMGTKEKNTMVRSASETALVVLMQLKRGDKLYQVSINLMDHIRKD